MVAVGEGIAVAMGAVVGVDTLVMLLVVTVLFELCPGEPVARK